MQNDIQRARSSGGYRQKGREVKPNINDQTEVQTMKGGASQSYCKTNSSGIKMYSKKVKDDRFL